MPGNPFRNLVTTLFLKQGTARSASVYGLASIFTQAIMMLYLVIIVRWLGADQYGYIAAAYAATGLTAILFNWGLNEWLIQRGAVSDQVNILGGKVIVFKFVSGSFWVILVWLGAQWIRPDLYLPEILLLIILDELFDSLFGTLLAILILRQKINSAAVLLVLSRISRLATGLLLIWSGTQSVFAFSFIRTATTLAVLLLTWALTKPTIQAGMARSMKQIFRQSSAFNSSQLITLSYMQIDVNLLAFLGADRALIANYSIIIGLILAILTLPSGIHGIVLPDLVRKYKQAKEHFILSMRKVYISFTALTLGVVLSLIFLAPPLLRLLLGSSFAQSQVLLLLLSPMAGLMVLNQASTTYLIATGQQVKRLLPQGIALVFKLLFGFWAVSRLMESGMVLASTLAEVVLMVGYLVLILRHYKQNMAQENII